MSIYVQFTDEHQLAVTAVFAEPQDEAYWPNQGVVTDDDDRYLAYIASKTGNIPVSKEDVIAAERFRREASGVSVGELLIETTRDSQALIASTGLSAILDPEYRCNFKTAKGFVEIGAAQIIEIAKAVRAHVQACFDRELTLLRAIEAGEYHDEMLAEGWPDSSSPDTADLK
ncbi:DUF4376 domain-containing protein [Pseudomonas sp. COW5]|uniref:DUF4376 domain-containing protein n=1 Tax=Pseudomonas sp. COW5 TaxID=2981253 RepID=UPI0022458AD0|nr:DUF4376 domain-containing protein [Pseudomonas sp. COW5]MCX2542243.1 DUF4376 domain-containing protein [Pseudomonas sp. COW5]